MDDAEAAGVIADPTSHRRRRRGTHRSLAMLSPVLVAFSASAAFLFTFHVAAENSFVPIDDNYNRNGFGGAPPPPRTFYERIQGGPESLHTVDKIFFCSVIVLALELLNYLTQHLGQWLNSPLIPVRGKHLDVLTRKDLMFIGISKAQTPPFVYLYLRWGYYNPSVLFNFTPTLANTVLPLVPLFIIYDLFYTALHWFLHIKSIYSFVHKHHHVQKAPSRANTDSINVHPLEFFLGEYNHLLSLCLCAHFVCQVHVVGSVLFLAVGGALAGINHTRYDICINVWGVHLFDSKAHDVHHRIPQSNYGQYTMFWDYIFGTFRPYNPKDRINADAQLDPRTGKSLAYMKEHQS